MDVLNKFDFIDMPCKDVTKSLIDSQFFHRAGVSIWNETKWWLFIPQTKLTANSLNSYLNIHQSIATHAWLHLDTCVCIRSFSCPSTPTTDKLLTNFIKFTSSFSVHERKRERQRGQKTHRSSAVLHTIHTESCSWKNVAKNSAFDKKKTTTTRHHSAIHAKHAANHRKKVCARTHAQTNVQAYHFCMF